MSFNCIDFSIIYFYSMEYLVAESGTGGLLFIHFYLLFVFTDSETNVCEPFYWRKLRISVDQAVK